MTLTIINSFVNTVKCPMELMCPTKHKRNAVLAKKSPKGDLLHAISNPFLIVGKLLFEGI